MKVPMYKRWEYWNHFLAMWAANELSGPSGLTRARLGKVRDRVLADDEFWADVVVRHGGMKQTPEEMRDKDLSTYEHCMGNFWGMLYQDMVRMRLVR